MPAPEVAFRPHDTRPALGHVNLMLDTFIANAHIDDLRSIARDMIATGPAGVVPTFVNAARYRLRQSAAKTPTNLHILFRRPASEPFSTPTAHLFDALARARSMYGAGLGFTSLGVLTFVVRATHGHRWEEDGDMADALSFVDADIGQAIQSAKEEIEDGRVIDYPSARKIMEELRHAVNNSLSEVSSWGGEFPFQRASATLEYWKI